MSLYFRYQLPMDSDLRHCFQEISPDWKPKGSFFHTSKQLLYIYTVFAFTRTFLLFRILVFLPC